MNTKTLNLLCAALLSPLAAAAQEIDPDTARSLARQFFTTKDHAASSRVGRSAPATMAEPVLSYTATTNGIPDFYVFNRGGEPSADSGQAQGFVIINAHGDTQTSTLGYSDNGNFDYDALPDNLRWWLRLYQTNGVAQAPAHAAAQRHNIAPLVSTKWGQNEPYNNAIPCQSGYKPFPTGCVATAMAQIMKHWNHPIHGNGSNSYVRNYNGGEFSLTFEADFAHTTYDWANMLDSYTGNSATTTQKNAAALLAYHAGVSVNMKYAGTSSSSDSRDAAAALSNTFCYDHSIMVGQRTYFSDADWDQTIYDELVDGRPLLYAGSTLSGAGHAFVCHGYDAENELFAINWGWNGNYDGYFALVGPDALKPHGTGTGGGSADESYADNQRIIYHIFPDQGGDPVMQIGTYDGGFTAALNSSGSNTFDHLEVDRSKPDADLRVYYNYSPFNYGAPTVNGQYGVMLRNVVNGAVYHNAPQFSISLASREYVASSTYYSFNTSLLPRNGTYELLPAFCTSDAPDVWHTIATPSSQHLPTITITGGAASEPVALPITLDETNIEVGKTATITLSPHYTGRVDFSSSNPEVASVDDQGIITAQQLGAATITVSAAGDEAFLPTQLQFSVNVVEHVLRPFEMKVGKTNLLCGETTSIICKGYSGRYVYNYSPSGVVKAEADGTVRALTSGKATLLVTADSPDYDHYQTTTAFTFDVKPAISTPSALRFTSYPYVGRDNLLTTSDCIVNLPIANASETTLTPARVYYTIQSDKGFLKGHTGYQSLKPGQGGTATIDLTNFTSYFSPGKAYAVSFYSDENRTVSLNIAQMEFYKGKTTSITLDVNQGVCTTLSLPFAASVPDGLEAYELDAYYDNTLRLTRVSALESGRSYIVAGASGTYHFTGEAGPTFSNPVWRLMTGIHSSTHVPAGSYVLSGNTANAFVRTKTSTSTPLWTAYVTIPTVSDDILSLSQFTDASLITGVDVLQAPPTSTAIFTLDGRPIPSLRPGINIVRSPDGTVRKIEVR